MGFLSTSSGLCSISAKLVTKLYGECKPLKPNHILKGDNYLDASKIGFRLEYVKKWIPEDWHLAFWDTLHLLPQKDFKLLEDVIKKYPSVKITS